MPIYEYECSECSCRFEKKQRFHDEPVAECPRCQSKSKRIMVPSGIIFKGSGFYVTDYPKSSSGEQKPSKSSVPADTNKKESAPVKASEGPKTETTSTNSGGGSKTPDSSTPVKGK